MSKRRTSETDRPTSSPASEGGATPCASLAYQTTLPFGPDRAHASHSASSDAGEAPTTSGTCGLSGIASSQSADLQSCLASRLRARLGGDGLGVYVMTWKRQAMPSGLPSCRLQASALRTLGTESTGVRRGWGTPTASQPGGCWTALLDRKRRMSERGIAQGVSVTQLAHQIRSIGQTESGGLSVGTDSYALPSPEFTCWLMGVPLHWLNCAPSATPSFRSSRRRSS